MFAISDPGWVIQNLEAVIFDKDVAISDIQRYWRDVICTISRRIPSEKPKLM